MPLRARRRRRSARRHDSGDFIMPNVNKRRFKRINAQDEAAALLEIRTRGARCLPALIAAIDVTYPELRRELLQNIVRGWSYEHIRCVQGYVPLNRADFYGCRRKAIAIYAQIRRREEGP